MKLASPKILLAACTAFFLACAGSAPVAESIPAAKIHLRTLEMPSYSWDANKFINLDISRFPDSVSFYLPIGKDYCDIKSAKLLDDVFGWEDECEFISREFGVPFGSNIIIVEDISASMGDYLPFTDRLIWGFVSTLIESGCEVSLVRFGESSEVTVPWILPDSFLNLEPNALPYPNERGSDLSGAIEKALELASKRTKSSCAIVLFSDGDFALERFPHTLVERAKRNNISINILLHGKNPKGALADIADETGGIYFVQPEGGFSAQLVSAIIAQSFFISFSPKHRNEDGALHRISLILSDNRIFRGEFRAPGNIPTLALINEPLKKDFVMPDSLIPTRIIPFDSAGNHRLLESGEAILNNMLNGISKLPDSLDFIFNISGYACNLGSPALNIRLSKQRAEVVRDFIKPKIGKNFKIALAWHGELYPLNENRDEPERRLNRRVEVSISPIDGQFRP